VLQYLKVREDDVNAPVTIDSPSVTVNGLSSDDWDRLLLRDPYSNVMQSYRWGESHKILGIRPIRLLFHDGGQIFGQASILEKKVFTRRIWYLPRGPILHPPTKEAWTHALEALLSVARCNGVLWLKLNPDIEKHAARFLEELLASDSFRRKDGSLTLHDATVKIDLAPDEDALFKSFRPRVRSYVRKTADAGVEVLCGHALADMQQFHGLLSETAYRKRFPTLPAPFYWEVYRQFVARGDGHLFLAKFRGQIVSAALILVFGDRCYYKWGASASDSELQGLRPSSLMHWRIMTWAKTAGLKEYDLHGVSLLEQPGNAPEGVRLWKSGFGGRYVELVGEYDYVSSTFLARLLPKMVACYSAYRYAATVWRHKLRRRRLTSPNGINLGKHAK
jgi:lipid II:glycine glycyltransferase (peptidoglycan interpeptide bridge formation enzyme)